ncbi:polysaccharide deacetylase family protein [Rariglobus hedericola]|nr:polysaccharide deacetylase family protein [Rariglobus hedericola]
MTSVSAQPMIKSVQTGQPVVALTFDDGPHATQTPVLLELFARENIKVTFFEIGQNVAKHPDLARAIVTAGHEIANHSKTHPKLGDMSDIAAIRAELVETQTIIKEATGITPVVFRAPYISHGPALWTVLGELKLPSISGSFSASDWDAKVTEDQIIATCSQAGAGDIVILHTWPEKTADALPAIIANLRAKGLRFVTVSELLALAAAK